jgi:hypothetical protein
MSTLISIKDAGIQAVGGVASTVTAVNSGDWINLPTSRINFEMTTKSTSNQASEDVDGYLKPNPNEVSAVLPVRLNVNMFLNDTQGAVLTQLQSLQQTTNIKLIRGGVMTIDNMLDSVDDGSGGRGIYVIVKNVTVSEVIATDTAGVTITIQLEQVI